MDDRSLSAIVLAAGEGTRMRSNRPKPLHLLCGRAMLLYVLDALADCRCRPSRRRRRPRRRARHQEAPGRGTRPAARLRRAARAAGHRRRRERRPHRVPRRRPRRRRRARAARRHAAAASRHRGAARRSITATPTPRAPCSPPASPIRPATAACVRGKDDRVRRIVEQSDATDEEREIDEVNTSIYCFRRSLLAPALRRLSPENAQGEYYLTDVVEVLYDAGYPVVSVVADDPARRKASTTGCSWPSPRPSCASAPTPCGSREGVTMLDPERTYIDTTVELATDVTLFPGTMLQGRCVIGAGAEIGPDTRLVDCIVGPRRGSSRRSGRDAEIGDRAQVGPFAVLEPGIACPVRDPHRAVLHCYERRRRIADDHAEGRLRRDNAAWATRWSSSPRSGCYLVSGRAHLPLAEEIAERLGCRAGRAEPRRVRQRRAALPLRRVDPRHRRLHRADPLGNRRAVAQRRAHGAADHGRRREAGVGQAHHRGVPVLRLRPPGPEVRGARADHRQARRRHVQGRRRVAAHQRRPALRADPGLLRRARRPPRRHAGAGRVPVRPRRRPRRRVTRRRPGEGGRALRQPPERRPRHRAQAPRHGREESGRGPRRRRRRRRPHLRADRRHDRHRRHDRRRRRAAGREGRHRGVRRVRPTACSAVRPSTG